MTDKTVVKWPIMQIGTLLRLKKAKTLLSALHQWRIQGEGWGGCNPPFGKFSNLSGYSCLSLFHTKHTIVSYNMGFSPIDHYKKTVAIPLLDSLIIQMQDRFSDEDRQAVFCTTTAWNFQKLFYGGNVVRFLVHFFFTHFLLALVAASMCYGRNSSLWKDSIGCRNPELIWLVISWSDRRAEPRSISWQTKGLSQEREQCQRSTCPHSTTS